MPSINSLLTTAEVLQEAIRVKAEGSDPKPLVALGIPPVKTIPMPRLLSSLVFLFAVILSSGCVAPQSAGIVG